MKSSIGQARDMSVRVRAHPQGGWTIGVPVPGTVTTLMYVGHYGSARQAAAALEPAREKFGRAVALAGVLAEAVPC